MGYDFILEETKGSTAIIRFNRPEVRNALGLELRMELLSALEKAEQDEQAKSIIITGEGKGFSAGGDLSALQALKPLEGRKRLQQSHPLMLKLLEIEKPVIAAVNGAAAGAGFSLTLLCDFIVAAEDAFFVQSFVNVGLIPDFAAMHFLPRLIGAQRAKELMLLGERVTAQEAYKFGIVNRVVPADELIPEAQKLADQLATKAPAAVGMTKKIVNQHLNPDVKILLEMEAQGQEICFQTEDFKEGVQAFYEKRKPKFSGK